jgi:hypothetical protein
MKGSVKNNISMVPSSSTSFLQPETISNMPPRKFVQQSQEFVYKQVGRGGRSRLKPVPVALEEASSSGSGSQPNPDMAIPLPPAITAPTSNAYDDAGGTEDTPLETQLNFEVPKKRGKVSGHDPDVGDNTKLLSFWFSEAVRVHEILVRREKK